MIGSGLTTGGLVRTAVLRRPATTPDTQSSQVGYQQLAQIPTAQASAGAGSNGGELYGYGNLPPGFSWQAQSAPTTGDTVYYGTAPNGQTVYVGPDNQPYQWSGGGLISPSISESSKTTWADLLSQVGISPSQASSDVAYSTYNGPNATPQLDAYNYGHLPAGETLIGGPQGGTTAAAATSPGSGTSSATDPLTQLIDAITAPNQSPQLPSDVPYSVPSTQGPSPLLPLLLLAAGGAAIYYWYRKHHGG